MCGCAWLATRAAKSDVPGAMGHPMSLSFRPGAALVTGNGRVASALTRLLARAAIPVVFTYHHRAEEAHALEAALCAQGARARALRLDLNDPVSIAEVVAQAAEFGGGLAHLFTAAGAMMPFARMADLPPAAFEAFFLPDTMGTWHLAVAAMPWLRQARGTATFCTTIATYRVVAFDGASPFAKAAIEAMMRQFAAEEAVHGVRANAVAVSWVSDEAYDAQLALINQAPEPEAGRMRHLLAQIRDNTPLARATSGEEAAWTFAFLASDQAGAITGHTILLDGGFHLGAPPPI